MVNIKNNKTFILLAGILFAASINSDPFIHDHFEESESLIECQLCENKTADIKNVKSVINENIQSSLVSIEINQELFTTNSKYYQSRAPPKK
jgi:fructose-1-phosphate kinase PfkB-like protein